MGLFDIFKKKLQVTNTDYNQKGNYALKIKNYSEAVTHFSNSLKYKKSSSAYQNRGYAYTNLKKYDLAKRDFEDAIKLTIGYLDNADKNNINYIDGCLRDIIRLKASIGQIEMESNNLQVVESINTELIGLYRSMSNTRILSSDLNLCLFYSNRSMAKLQLNKVDEAVRDMGAAFVESVTEKEKNEILTIAEIYGLSEKLKECVAAYSFLKKKGN